MQRYLFFFNYKVIILKKLCHLPIESTSKCKFVAKLGKMFEKDLIWGKEI